MSGKQFNKKLDQQLKEISDPKFMFFVVSDTHAKQVKRIFTQGIKSDGSKIGQYNSSTPIYINPINSPKKFPTVGKNGRQGKTGYFESYKAFRQAIGRETGFVNLRLTNRLQSDFANSLERSGATYITGIKFPENVGKVEGNTDRYGEIFGLTVAERKFFNSEITKILIKKLNDD